MFIEILKIRDFMKLIFFFMKIVHILSSIILAGRLLETYGFNVAGNLQRDNFIKELNSVKVMY